MKKIAFFILMFNQFLHGQNTFNKRMYFQKPFAVLTSIFPTDSCYYATGVITDTLNSTYKLGNIFVKFDLTGDTLFTKKLLDPNKYYQTWRGGLVQTHDGLLATTGYTVDSVLKAIFIKYDLSGDTVLTQEYFNPFYPQVSFITSVALANHSQNGYYFLCGINPDANNPEGDVMVLKLDSVGTPVQENIYGGNSTEVGGTLLVDVDDEVTVGASKTNVNQVLKNFYSRTYIFKTDSFGNVIWEYQSPPNRIQDAARGLAQSENGSLVVATSRGFEHPVNIDIGQLRWESAYFFKIDHNQKVEWELEVFDSIRPSPGNKLQKLISVDNGQAFVAAGHYNMIQSLDPPNGGTFGWLFKFTGDGELVWVRKHQILETLGHRHEVSDLKQTHDGGLLIVGNAQGDINTVEPATQAWLLKLDSHGCLIPGCEAGDTVSAAGLPVLQNPELAIYPNPAVDYLNFQVRGTPYAARQGRFRILDAGGREVKSFPAHDLRDAFIVPVWDWAAGVYFLHYQDGEGREASQKFLIVKK